MESVLAVAVAVAVAADAEDKGIRLRGGLKPGRSEARAAV